MRGRTAHHKTHIDWCRAFGLFLMTTFLMATICLEAAAATHSVSDIRILRKLGRYDEAITQLNDILADASATDDVRKSAYNELATAYHEQGDESKATEVAKTAITEFPDIEIDPSHHPKALKNIYEQFRKEMYGTIDIRTTPTGCDVFLNGDEIGKSPLKQYVSTGDYTLKIRKWDYVEDVRTINVPTDSTISLVVQLKPYAVESRWKRVRFGFQVGLSSTSLSYQGDKTSSAVADRYLGMGQASEWENLRSLSPGLILDMPVSYQVSFQPELRYVQIGNRATYVMEGDLPTGEYDLIHQFIALPLIFKFFPMEHPRLFLSGGIEPAYMLSARLEGPTGEDIDVSDMLSPMNVSIIVGGGYEHPIGTHRIMISAQYFIGLIGLKDDAHPESINYKSREFRLSLGFII